ncbi:hypothetical protein [Candidatus Stoquefichus sp. SB1]|nr:hypothetical protein [Candidatus Stoquefichus sp. SB1]
MFGCGSVLFTYSVVEANSKIGKGSIIASNVVINHDVQIDEYVL